LADLLDFEVGFVCILSQEAEDLGPVDKARVRERHSSKDVDKLTDQSRDLEHALSRSLDSL
jgi:hypothetical protein